MAESDNRQEQDAETNPTPQQPPAHEPAPPPKKRRRWPWVVGAILLLLLIGAALLPTIASSSWGTGLIVGQANKLVDGRVAIDGMSIGWGGGAQIRGLRIYQDEALILDVPHLSTGISFYDLLSGDYYDLGQTKGEIASFVLKRYADGTTNFHKVFRIPPPTDEPIVVPPIKGTVDLAARGTIEQHLPDGQIQVVHVDSAKVNAAIPDINAPIKHDVSIAVRVADQPPGTILAKGDLQLFRNFTLDLAALSGNEDVEIKGVQGGSVAALLPAGLGISTLTGEINGKFIAQLTGTGDTFVEGRATVAQLAVGGPLLKGDTYRSSQLSLIIPRTILNKDTGRIQITPSADAKLITISTDHAKADFVINATAASLQRLAGNQAPGDEGLLNITIRADIAVLANQLPNLLKIERDIKVTSGQFDHSTSITLLSQRAVLKSNTTLTNLKGTGPKGQVQARDIGFDLNAVSLGGGGAIPDLRDLSLVLTSGFANAKGGGASLEKFSLTGSANLAELHKELAQFVALGAMRFGGTANFTVNTSGDLAAEGGRAKLQLELVTTDLDLGGLTEQPIKEPWARVIAGGTLVRGKETFVKAIDEASFAVKTSSEQKPTADLALAAQVILTPNVAVPSFKIIRGQFDLPALQRELGAAIPALPSDIALQGGTLTLSGEGSYAPNALALKSVVLKGNQIAFKRGEGAFGPQDMNVTLSAAIGDRLIEVTELAGNLGIANVKLIEAIVIREPAGQMTASGKLSIDGQVRPAMALLAALQGTKPDPQSELAGAYTITQSVQTKGQALQLTGEGSINDLTVGPPDKPVFREPAVAFVNEISADQKANTLRIEKLGIDMPTSKALSASLRGSVSDYASQRNLQDMRLSLSYDADKLLQLLLPLLDPATREQLKTLKVAGIVRDREFVIAGNYPAEPVKVGNRFRQPIEYVKASGSLYFDRVEYTGMPAERVEVPLHLSNGELRTTYADRADPYGKPVAFSGGTLDLTGLELSFAGKHLRVTSLRPNHKLLDNVMVSEQFVNQFLGSTHPLFAGATAVRGKISVTIDKMQNLPLDNALVKPTAKTEGEGAFSVSFTEFALVNPLTRIITSELVGLKMGADGTLPMSIPKAEFRLVPGKAFSSLTMDIGKHSLGFRDGEVRLSDNRIQSMLLVVPTALVPALRDQKFIASVPSLEIPMTGSLTAPQFNIAGAATNLIKKQFTKPENLLDLLNRDKDKERKDTKKDEAPPGTIGKRAPAEPKK